MISRIFRVSFQKGDDHIVFNDQNFKIKITHYHNYFCTLSIAFSQLYVPFILNTVRQTFLPIIIININKYVCFVDEQQILNIIFNAKVKRFEITLDTLVVQSASLIRGWK